MKIKEQILSREQMKHLQELGVDTSDASMVWIKQDSTLLPDNIKELWWVDTYYDSLKPMVEQDDSGFVQTYTIGDLIKKLPEELEIEHKVYCREIIMFNDLISVSYYNNVEVKLLFSIDNTDDKKSTLIKLLYMTLCWVAEKQKELLEVKK